MAVERRIQEIYGNRADLFSGGNDTWFGPIAEKILNSYLEEKNHHGSVLAVDLGCGHAALGVRLLSNNPNIIYTGIDLTPEMIKAAKLKLESRHMKKYHLIEASFRDDNSKTAVFKHSADVVFAIAASDGEKNFWEHMKKVTSYAGENALVVDLEYYQGNQHMAPALTPARIISMSFQELGRMRRERGLTMAGAIKDFFSQDTRNLAKLAFDKEFKEFDLNIGRPNLEDIKEFAEIAKGNLRVVEQGPFRPAYLSFVVTKELISEIYKRTEHKVDN